MVERFNELLRLLTAVWTDTYHTKQRITAMDARVQELVASVAALGTKVDTLITKVGVLDPADAAEIVAVKTQVDAIAAKVDAAVTPPAPPVV